MPEHGIKVVGFIPARAASSRFPGKPLADICGKPMIVRVYERALESDAIEDVYVATDSEMIMESVIKHGAKCIMTSTDHPSGTDRIAEAANRIGLNSSDIVVNIQGDQPLFEPRMINEVVNPLLNDASIPMSTLIYRIVRDEEIDHPNAVKTVFDQDGFALYFSRSTIPYYREGEIQRDYYKHHGVYAYRKDFLDRFVLLPVGSLEVKERLEQLRALENGYKVKVVITEFDSIEVDTPEDLLRVNNIYAKMI
ncbi:MAG: 3-deoxy-manno-octulosonate cytidylyltransferase [Desulfomonilaceae bacterium]